MPGRMNTVLRPPVAAISATAALIAACIVVCVPYKALASTINFAQLGALICTVLAVVAEVNDCRAPIPSRFTIPPTGLAVPLLVTNDVALPLPELLKLIVLALGFVRDKPPLAVKLMVAFVPVVTGVTFVTPLILTLRSPKVGTAFKSTAFALIPSFVTETLLFGD